MDLDPSWIQACCFLLLNVYAMKNRQPGVGDFRLLTVVRDMQLYHRTVFMMIRCVPRIHNFESSLMTLHLLTNLAIRWRIRNTRYLGEGVMQDTVTPEYVNWFFSPMMMLSSARIGV
ncbi:hypothetical protein JCGZ_19123 [Jatropha curcas]|uniref:Uncharacterized protein n=1 Tax=Jatropha curcas TaxID=180498 RepID=A0A067K046_JATCU|nr:hypothetical protein JCGZ_19123 [Jatropha curcas]